MPRFHHSQSADRALSVFEAVVVPAFHPEFGYLWPSPPLRRGFRIAVISSVVGILIGASIVLSIKDRRLAESEQIGHGVTFVKTDRDPGAVDPAKTSYSQISLAAGEDTTMPIAQNSCAELGGSFLDSKCRLANFRKMHVSRLNTTRLRSITIGQLHALPEVERQASASRSGTSSQMESGPTDTPKAAPDPSTVGVERAVGSTPKSAKPARSRVRSGGRKSDDLNTFAHESAYGHYYRYGDAHRGEREASKGSWNWAW